jgi:hypothetical protein
VVLLDLVLVPVLGPVVGFVPAHVQVISAHSSNSEDFHFHPDFPTLRQPW